jgi:hypothetical protein
MVHVNGNHCFLVPQTQNRNLILQVYILFKFKSLIRLDFHAGYENSANMADEKKRPSLLVPSKSHNESLQSIGIGELCIYFTSYNFNILYLDGEGGYISAFDDSFQSEQREQKFKSYQEMYKYKRKD